MTPETREYASDLIGQRHDDLIVLARNTRHFRHSRERSEWAAELLKARRCLRDLERIPFSLPRNDCE